MDDGLPNVGSIAQIAPPELRQSIHTNPFRDESALSQFYDERRHCAPVQIQLSRQRGPQQGTAKMHLPPCPAQIATPCLYIYTTPPSPRITIGRRSSFGPERQNRLPSRRIGSEIPVD